MRRGIPLLGAFLSIWILYRVFHLVRAYEPGGRPPPGYKEAGLGDISIQLGKSEIISRLEGRRQWSLQVDRIDLHHTSFGGDPDQFSNAVFANIREGVFYRNGKPEAKFSANRATFDNPTQQFNVHGKIRVRTVHGDTVEADDLIWSDRDDYVRFTNGAKGVFKGNRLTAPVVFYSPKKRTLQCPQGAEGTFKGYPLKASVLYWDIGAERVEMPGHVSGDRRGLHFTANQATLDLKTRELKANDGTAELRIQGGDVDFGSRQ